LTAYQEELPSLDELRRRMPELRQREHALQTELNSILDQISDRAVFLRLAETLSGFLSRLRSSADTLDIQERQRIVRLVVRDILVGDETIVIRHSIPLSSKTPSGDGGVQSKSAAPPAPGGRSYLLRSGSNYSALRRPPLGREESAFSVTARCQHRLDETQNPAIGHTLGHKRKKFLMNDRPKEVLQVRVYNPFSAGFDFLSNLA
jgi:site-specific DNA recombinase